MTAAIRIVDMLSADHLRHATQLVFEYYAMTQAETGRPVPENIDQLPAVLRTECQNLWREDDTEHETYAALRASR